jgi:hypothetical protein
MSQSLNEGFVVAVDKWDAKDGKPAGVSTTVAVGKKLVSVRANGFVAGEPVFIAGEILPNGEGRQGFWLKDGKMIARKQGETIAALVESLERSRQAPGQASPATRG